MSRPRDRWLLESPERQQQVTTSSHPSPPRPDATGAERTGSLAPSRTEEPRGPEPDQPEHLAHRGEPRGLRRLRTPHVIEDSPMNTKARPETKKTEPEATPTPNFTVQQIENRLVAVLAPALQAKAGRSIRSPTGPSRAMASSSDCPRARSSG